MHIQTSAEIALIPYYFHGTRGGGGNRSIIEKYVSAEQPCSDRDDFADTSTTRCSR